MKTRVRFGRRSLTGLLGVALAFVAIPAASADTISIVGNGAASTEGLGAFTGSISYDEMLKELLVSLKNTTAPATGGYITGFLFNFATTDSGFGASSVVLTSVTGVGNAANWSEPTGNGLSGSPFGNPYMSGAAVGGDFLGGGAPSSGIAIGGTGEFKFTISTSDAGSLSAASFLQGGAYTGAPNYEYDFIVRFRGMANDGSDKVPAMEQVVVVPLPTPALLAGVGLIGILGLRRWSRLI